MGEKMGEIPQFEHGFPREILGEGDVAPEAAVDSSVDKAANEKEEKIDALLNYAKGEVINGNLKIEDLEGFVMKEQNIASVAIKENLSDMRRRDVQGIEINGEIVALKRREMPTLYRGMKVKIYDHFPEEKYRGKLGYIVAFNVAALGKSGSSSEYALKIMLPGGKMLDIQTDKVDIVDHTNPADDYDLYDL